MVRNSTPAPRTQYCFPPTARSGVGWFADSALVVAVENLSWLLLQLSNLWARGCGRCHEKWKRCLDRGALWITGKNMGSVCSPLWKGVLSNWSKGSSKMVQADLIDSGRGSPAFLVALLWEKHLEHMALYPGRVTIWLDLHPCKTAEPYLCWLSSVMYLMLDMTYNHSLLPSANREGISYGSCRAEDSKSTVRGRSMQQSLLWANLRQTLELRTTVSKHSSLVAHNTCPEKSSG